MSVGKQSTTKPESKVADRHQQFTGEIPFNIS